MNLKRVKKDLCTIQQVQCKWMKSSLVWALVSGEVLNVDYSAFTFRFN